MGNRKRKYRQQRSIRRVSFIALLLTIAFMAMPLISCESQLPGEFDELAFYQASERLGS